MRLSEIGFQLIMFAGIWLGGDELPVFGFHRARGIIAGAALALAGLLLIIAVHWGQFG